MTIPSLSVAGKLVVVTGASKGLDGPWRSDSREAGADVVVSSRKLPPCEEAAAEARARGGRALGGAVPRGRGDQCACD